MSSGIGRRRGSDPTLLWLWCRPAAIALIRPLAREPPYAMGVALEKAKRQKKKKKKRKENSRGVSQWLTNPTRNHEVVGSIPGLAQWVEDPVLP